MIRITIENPAEVLHTVVIDPIGEDAYSVEAGARSFTIRGHRKEYGDLELVYRALGSMLAMGSR